MDLQTILKTQICQEHDDDFNTDWFKYTQKKFISHIDTLYYSVYPVTSDWNKDERKIFLMDYIKKQKNLAEQKREPISIFSDFQKDLQVQPFFGFRMYAYHFGIHDKFDVFICDSVPNVKTPPIMVQIRSQSLWLDGLKNSFDKSADVVIDVLEHYGFKVEKIQENRIDFAHHTNYIQDMMRFFPEEYLREMQVSNFARWHKEGTLSETEITSDYFTLGRRNSNNVFFRVYNKTKEVIEMGYKQFFIALWLREGLINKFDEWVIANAFKFGSYEAKDKARCEFYAIFGTDYSIRSEIAQRLADSDTPLSYYVKRAKGLVPDITIITNIEFQTKRKLFDRLSQSIPQLVEFTSVKSYIYNIFEQLKPISDFLTSQTLRFVKYKGEFSNVERIKRENADWWERLRNTKPLEYSDAWIIDYFRAYQISLDIERRKELAITSLAGFSAIHNIEEAPEGYMEPEEFGFNNDVFNYINYLNDNDIEKYYSKRDKNIEKLRKMIK